MSFRLIPNSVTLDDLERRNSPNGSLISPNSVAFGPRLKRIFKINLERRKRICIYRSARWTGAG